MKGNIPGKSAKWKWGKQSIIHGVQKNGYKDPQGAQWELPWILWNPQYIQGCTSA